MKRRNPLTESSVEKYKSVRSASYQFDLRDVFCHFRGCLPRCCQSMASFDSLRHLLFKVGHANCVFSQDIIEFVVPRSIRCKNILARRSLEQISCFTKFGDAVVCEKVLGIFTENRIHGKSFALSP